MLVNQASNIRILVTQVFFLVPAIVFLFYFFMLKKKVIIWTYITFGISILGSLLNSQFISAIISLLVGWAVLNYVKKKKVDGKPVFN